MSGGGINQLADLWKREAVLGTSFIEVGEVHADPLFPCLLFYHHYVGQPLRIVDLFYCFCLEQLLDLLNHGLGLWDPSSVCFLDHGLLVGVHIQLVAHDYWVDVRHLIWCPCKDLFILEEEVEQLRLLGLGELASYQEESVRVGRADFDLGEVLYALLRRSPTNIPELCLSV
ncbi:hypothetical protein AAC387_Pa12g0603 [Persea americana]